MSVRASVPDCHLLEITEACGADPDECTVAVTRQAEITKFLFDISSFLFVSLKYTSLSQKEVENVI